MRNRIVNRLTVSLAAAGLLVAGVAQAQSQHRRNEKTKVVIVRPKNDNHRNDRFDRNDRYDRNTRYDRHDRYDRYDRRIPPGQLKRRYPVYQPSYGANVLGGVLRNRGYRVVRVIDRGNTRYVYYVPAGNYYGDERWIAVRPDYYEDGRLYFDNAPANILQAILSQLY